MRYSLYQNIYPPQNIIEHYICTYVHNNAEQSVHHGILQKNKEQKRKSQKIPISQNNDAEHSHSAEQNSKGYMYVTNQHVMFLHIELETVPLKPLNGTSDGFIILSNSWRYLNLEIRKRISAFWDTLGNLFFLKYSHTFLLI